MLWRTPWLKIARARSRAGIPLNKLMTQLRASARAKHVLPQQRRAVRALQDPRTVIYIRPLLVGVTPIQVWPGIVRSVSEKEIDDPHEHPINRFVLLVVTPRSNPLICLNLTMKSHNDDAERSLFSATRSSSKVWIGAANEQRFDGKVRGFKMRVIPVVEAISRDESQTFQHIKQNRICYDISTLVDELEEL